MADDKPTAYAYKTTLKRVYGLTDSMIRELGVPDKVVPNPHYRSGSPAALYLRSRVTEWIDANRERWEKAQTQRLQRSAAAKAVHDRRRAEAVERAKATPVVMDNLPTLRELVKWTKRNGDNFLLARQRYDKPFIVTAKAVVAFVRHNMTNYETLLAEFEDLYRTVYPEAYFVLRERVDGTITARLEAAYGAGWPSEVDRLTGLLGI